MKLFFLLPGLFFSLSTFSYDSYLVKFENPKVKFNFKNKKQNDFSFRFEDLNISGSSLGVFYKEEKFSDDSFIKKIKSLPGVEFVEPNYKLHIVENLPDLVADPLALSQWGLFGNESINVVKAWEITKGSKNVLIAVVDTGVDYTHPDLQGQMWVNDAEKNGSPGADDDGNGFIDDIYGYDFANNDGDPMDDHEHGTHCAGIIGARHNDIGIAGVMGDVGIMAIKFLTSDGMGSTSNAIKAIDYAIKMGANILSNSWGGKFDQESILLEEAIGRARQRGILFVAAAGNESSNNEVIHNYPSDYEIGNIISVGSHNGNGGKSSFSNYSKTFVDVFAPGTSILSTALNGKYATLSGTSMATPFVAGVAGLLLSQYPQMSYLEIKDRLIKSSAKNGKLDNYSVSGGRVDAYRALENISQ